MVFAPFVFYYSWSCSARFAEGALDFATEQSCQIICVHNGGEAYHIKVAIQEMIPYQSVPRIVFSIKCDKFNV